jgi:hypothetical protein
MECASLTTLKEFEEALREQGMHMALAILEKLKSGTEPSGESGLRVALPVRR